MKKQLAEGQNINQQTKKKGFTALHIATLKAKPDLVKFLIENKADPNIKDSKGQTPIFQITNSMYYHKEIAQLLIDAGTDLEIKDNNGYTIWEYMISDETKHIHGQVKILDVLIENNCVIDTLSDETGKNLLHNIVKINKPENIIKNLTEKRNFEVDAVDINGWTALHFAVSADNYGAVKALIDAGADVNKKTTKLIGTWVGTEEKGHYLSTSYFPENSTPLDIDKNTGHSRLSKGVKKLLQENGAVYGEEK